MAEQCLELQGVGPQIAKYLARLDIHCLQDLLLHLPVRYQDRTTIRTIKALVPGESALIEGIITKVNPFTKGKTKLLCELQDATGRLQLRFFNVLPFQSKTLIVGARLRCFSEVRLGSAGLEMVHPEYHLLTEQKVIPIDSCLTPFYSTTQGLSQYVLRKISKQALTKLTENLPEIIPAQILQKLALPSIQEAITFIHQPPAQVNLPSLLCYETVHHKRLAFEELLAHRLSLLALKNSFQSQVSVGLPRVGKLIDAFIAQLVFKLTSAQLRVIKEIEEDLKKSQPMLRLVQGDVGSGKTVVAAVAMLQAIENGYQSALMAPTELLAEQHYQVLQKWLLPLQLNVQLLSGRIKGRERKAVIEAIVTGKAHVAVGTHALFQEEVKFAKLALVVVDEQHRFGVQERARLREKGLGEKSYPHQLIMTATPIPRTLGMTLYADLNCSIIDELPLGRKPIITSVVSNAKRLSLIESIKKILYEGRQGYWVCPLIEDSEALNCESAIKTQAYLQEYLPDFRIGLVHGRMKAQEKAAEMQLFQSGEIHLLVATTVIEVGVDVGNATVMIIENAERLGLSQLHQLRGRVGRSALQSHCILMYQAPLTPVALERLKVMRATGDGFKIAEKDLELRGPGEVLGTKQTGEIHFRLADLVRDSELIPDVKRIGEIIMSQHQDIIEPLLARWFKKAITYGDV